MIDTSGEWPVVRLIDFGAADHETDQGMVEFLGDRLDDAGLLGPI